MYIYVYVQTYIYVYMHIHAYACLCLGWATHFAALVLHTPHAGMFLRVSVVKSAAAFKRVTQEEITHGKGHASVDCVRMVSRKDAVQTTREHLSPYRPSCSVVWCQNLG